jgi:hypothetical protein
VVPKEQRAPVLQNHVESQVLGVAPPRADRARKPPLLAAKPGLAHPNPRADHRFFGPHKELVPSDTLLALPYGSAPRVPRAEAVPHEDHGLLSLCHDDARPFQVGANGVSAQVLPRRDDPAKVVLLASDDEPAVLLLARPRFERPARVHANRWDLRQELQAVADGELRSEGDRARPRAPGPPFVEFRAPVVVGKVDDP